MSTRVVGLEIGRYSIKAAVVDASYRTFELVEVIEEVIVGALDDPEKTAEVDAVGDDAEAAPAPAAPADEDPGLSQGTIEALQRLAARGVLQADVIATALPDDDVYVVPVTLPFDTEREIDAVLLPQLDGRLPEEIDELLVAPMVGGKAPEGGFQIFAAAARPERIAAFLGELAAFNVDPRYLEVSPFPLYTAAPWLVDVTPGPTAIIDIGAYRTGVIVIADGELQYVRSLTVGGEAITRALADTFSLSLDRAREGKHREGFIDAGLAESEAPTGDDAADTANACRRAVKPLVRQLRSTLHAHATSTGRPVERLVLSGATAKLPGLTAYIEQSLGVPTSVVAPTRSAVTAAPGFADDAPRFGTALGLAIRAAMHDRVPGSRLNFRRGPFSFRGSYEYLKMRAPALGIGFAAILLCAIAVVAGRVALLKAEQRHLDEALSTLTQEIFDEEITSPGRIRDRLTSADSGPALHPPRSAFELFVEVANAVGYLQDTGKPIFASKIDVDMDRFIFRVEGEASSAEAVDLLQEELARVDCFTSIQRTGLEERRGAEGLEFAVQGAIQCTGAGEEEAE